MPVTGTSAEPQRVYVEITNACNLRCHFCPGTSRPPARMDPEFFASLLTQITPLTSRISLHVLGEPLTHPDLPLLLEHCARAAVAVDLTTNGSLISRWSDDLLQSRALRQINFSLQSLDRAAGPDLDTLDRVLNFTSQVLLKRPELYVNFRLWTLDNLRAQEDSAFNRAVLERIGHDLHISTPTLVPGRKSRRLVGRVYVHADTVFTWPGDLPAAERHRGYCHALTSHCAILADGTVCPCCLDAEGRLALGNVRVTPLAQILASPRATAMRNGFSRGELVEDLCRHCSYCHRFEANRRQAPQHARANPARPCNDEKRPL